MADSVRFQLGLAKGRTRTEAAANQDRLARYKLAAAGVGCELDGIRIVRNAVSFGSLTLRRLGVDGELRARDIICSLAEYAAIHFGDIDEAILALASLGMTRGEDLGNIVFELVGHELLKASEGDRREHFDGLFTLDSLFDGW